MHVSQREKQILKMIEDQGFLAFQELDSSLDASPATLRRDLERLAREGKIRRVRGGAERAGGAKTEPRGLLGAPFHESPSPRTPDTSDRGSGRGAVRGGRSQHD